jgi:hypothetical protein
VFHKPVTIGWMLCTMLAACGDHDAPSTSPSSSVPQADTAAPLPVSSSDIQNWALQQTQPSTAVSSVALPKESPASPASDPLLPPVIHEAE